MIFADLERVFRLLVLGVVAWVVPERGWYACCRLVARVSTAFAALRGRTPDAPIDSRANLHRDTVEVLRCHRPGGWKPRIEVIGLERLTEASAGGRGVIVWVADFASASLIAKMALAQSGYPACHLSRPDHGFSDTAFGIRFLNPIRTRVEDRYLEERIMMKPDSRSDALRTLRRRLAEGRVVSITALDDGMQTGAVRLSEREIGLATGPITLSRASGAPLLPLFVVRKGPARFEAIVEAAIDVPEGREYEAPLNQYARVLEKYVRLQPAAWRSPK